MANVVKLKRSSVAAKVPATTDLQLGEMALNTTDGRLFSKKNVASVDSIIEFLSTDSAFKTDVKAATTASITLSGTQTIDGISCAAGDRVLVKNQATAAQNGIYIVAAGSWARATDADAAADLAGAVVAVSSGATNGGLIFYTGFKASNTLDTDAVNWTQLGLISDGSIASAKLGGDITTAGKALLTAADAAAQRTALGLVIGTNVQAYDAELAAIAGLASAADRLPYFTGLGTAALATFTAAGRALLDDADAAAQRATLGLGTMAVEAAASYALLASPAFTGTPTAPSAAAYTDTTQLATTAQVYDTVTSVPENAQTGTSYTLTLSDAGKMVTLTNAAAITLTIPTNASVAFPIGTRIDIGQGGAGQVTVGGAGVTIRSSGSKLKLSGQYSGATLWKKGTDEWWLIGDIAT